MNGDHFALKEAQVEMASFYNAVKAERAAARSEGRPMEGLGTPAAATLTGLV